MKRIVAMVLRTLWRMTSPVRRPLMARFDAHLSSVVAGTVNARMMPQLLQPISIALARLERIESTLERADRTASGVAEEFDLVLNGVSREIFRLQAQVEALHGLIGREMVQHNQGLSILDESEAETDDQPPLRRGSAPERSRVG